MKNYNFVKIFVSVAFILSLIFLFSCASGTPANINLTDLAEAVGEKIDLSDYEPYSLDKIRDEFGIKPDDVIEIIVLKKLDVTNISNAEMLILAQASDEEKAKEIEDKLKIYKTYKLKELENYSINPDNERQYYIVEDSEIILERQYVFFAVSPENKEINNIIREYIKNNK